MQKILSDFDNHATLSTRKRIEGMSDSCKYKLKEYLTKYLLTLNGEKPMLGSFIKWLIESKTLAASSKAMLATGIGKFLYWQTYISESEYHILLAGFRMPINVWSSKLLTEQQIASMLHLQNRCDTQLLRSRNKLIISLMAITGARVSQLVDLKIDDLRICENVITIAIPKKKEARVSLILNYEIKQIAINRTIDTYLLLDLLNNYLHNRFPHALTNALFISRNGNKLSYESFEKLIRSTADKLDYKNVTTHSFRHYVGNKLATTKGIETACQVLGHSDIKTTMRYINPETNDGAIL